MTPGAFVVEASTNFPKMREAAEFFRSGRGKDLPSWPVWCYLPMAAAISINMQIEGEMPDFDRWRPWDIACACAWAVTRGIYRFDENIFTALIDTPLTKIPAEALYQLPEWCVFVETPRLNAEGVELTGFFAWLEWDANDQRTELRLIWLTAGVERFMEIIHLTDNQGNPLTDIVTGQIAAIDEALKNATQRKDLKLENGTIDYLLDTRLDRAGKIEKQTAAALSLLLYLCSDDREISGPAHHPRPGNPRETTRRIKGGKNIPVEVRETVYKTAFELGKKLRAAKSAPIGTHASPSAHIRRAHWHTYRVGIGRTSTRIRWISTLLISGMPDTRDHIRIVK